MIAHSGGLGWDEMLYLAVPVLVLAALGWLARRRVDDDAGDDNPPSDGAD